MIDVLIIGSGALANAYAARLSSSDICRLQILGSWQEGIQAIHKRGIQLDEQGIINSIPPIFATTNIAEIQPAKLILLLVKSWQTKQLAPLLKQKLQNDGVCLTLQNGLGNLEILQVVFGRENANAGTTTLGATLVAPGKVKILANGSMLIGEHASTAWLIPLFQKHSFEIQSHPDLQSVLWGKLLINAIINPLTALLSVENGALEKDGQTLLLVDAMIDEILSVLAAKQINLPYASPHQKVREIIHESGRNHSSMFQDMQRNAPTEIEFITGAILREAGALNLHLPVNETIYRLVKSKIILNKN